jgi:hypothetical protein
MTQVGARINDVYSEADVATSGAGMSVGTRINDRGKEFVFVKIATSQNVVNGNVITIDASFNATLLTTGAPAPAGTSGGLTMAVAVCSVTASATQFIFAQLYGQGQVRVTDATASNLPNHIMVPGSTPGELRGGAATASAYISGITLMATASAAGLANCFINFPRMAIG